MTLHAASREALAAAELRLLELADAVSSPERAELGEELFAVLDLLIEQPALRRVLADASSDSAGREQFVRSLFSGKVGDAAMQVLVAVVTSRWSSPRELVDGIESLARTASLVRAEGEGQLDSVEDELFRLGRIVAGSHELELLLADPAGATDGKVALVDSLIEGKVSPVTKTLVDQLVRHPRGVRLADALAELADLAAKRRQRSVAHVRSAVELTSDQVDRLTATLTTIYSRPIALHVEVDSDLLGGLVIRVGDEVIDGSAAGRLDDLRRRMAG